MTYNNLEEQSTLSNVTISRISPQQLLALLSNSLSIGEDRLCICTLCHTDMVSIKSSKNMPRAPLCAKEVLFANEMSFAVVFTEPNLHSQK